MRQLRLISAWIPTLAGIALLMQSSRAELSAALTMALPAAFMITGGGRMLFSPDLRGPQHAAIGAMLGMLVALPAGLLGGPSVGLAALALSAAVLIAGGWFQIALQPRLADIPAPRTSLLYSARVALDNAMLSPFALMTPLPGEAELQRAAQESASALATFEERGWLENPLNYHQPPPVLQAVTLTPKKFKGLDCEQLHFESGFEPAAGLPGRDRWLAHHENRTARALLFRHSQPAPWLICVHGFGMGDYKKLIDTFRVQHLHGTSGLNVALFVLPLHGERAPGKISGEKFFGLSPLDFLHAESQALWDLRRLIGWIRRQGATQLGLYGISLGGYTCSVLAGLEEDLDCVIAGVPPSDVLHTGAYLASSIERRLPAAAGMDIERDRKLLSVVSPFTFAPRVSRERRFMYAATGDQFVPIEQISALWRHWREPRISWCTGGHLSALQQRAPRDLVDEAITATFGATS